MATAAVAAATAPPMNQALQDDLARLQKEFKEGRILDEDGRLRSYVKYEEERARVIASHNASLDGDLEA